MRSNLCILSGSTAPWNMNYEPMLGLYQYWTLVCRLVPVLVSKNRPDSYDLRQYQPHTSTWLRGTEVIPASYKGCTSHHTMRSYLPHASQKSPLDPIPGPGWYESLKKIKYNTQLVRNFFRRSNTSTRLVWIFFEIPNTSASWYWVCSKVDTFSTLVWTSEINQTL